MNIKNQSATAKFWLSVIDMEVLLFMFIRSLRDSDFRLFIQCFKDMLPWMATLNDMKYLSEAIFEEFTHGNFTIKKSHQAFSAIGIDQAHEQNNKVVLLVSLMTKELCYNGQYLILLFQKL